MFVQCNLEGMYQWDAIESNKVEWHYDRLALGAMIHGVPQDMHSMLLNKKLAKEAWDTIKSMCLGAERVKEVNAQKLLAESIAFKMGETIDDFAMHITRLATDLCGPGEESVDGTRVMKKFLWVVPPRYNQVAVTIKMFYDMKKLSIKELVGRLRVAKEFFEASVEQMTDKTCHLLLTEEWAFRNKSLMVTDSSS
jgi:hypothetical protein